MIQTVKKAVQSVKGCCTATTMALTYMSVKQKLFIKLSFPIVGSLFRKRMQAEFLRQHA